MVPLLQIDASKTDVEWLLIISRELTDLSAIGTSDPGLQRYRRSTRHVVRDNGEDLEPADTAAVQRRLRPEDRAITAQVISEVVNIALHEPSLT